MGAMRWLRRKGMQPQRFHIQLTLRAEGAAKAAGGKAVCVAVRKPGAQPRCSAAALPRRDGAVEWDEPLEYGVTLYQDKDKGDFEKKELEVKAQAGERGAGWRKRARGQARMFRRAPRGIYRTPRISAFQTARNDDERGPCAPEALSDIGRARGAAREEAKFPFRARFCGGPLPPPLVAESARHPQPIVSWQPIVSCGSKGGGALGRRCESGEERRRRPLLRWRCRGCCGPPGGVSARRLGRFQR